MPSAYGHYTLTDIEVLKFPPTLLMLFVFSILLHCIKGAVFMLPSGHYTYDC